MALLPPWVLQGGFVIALLGSVAAVRWLDRSGDWGRRRERLLLGVPWGTLLVVAVVLSVYLFLQGGLENWYRPAVVPFRSWSYFYPIGILASGFTHSGAGHLMGNLVGTLVFGVIAEYAWGHFPRDRGRTVGSSLRANPYARAFVLFPAGVFGVGVLTGVFSLGPTIGFSGVVFALAGFALTRFPIWAALGLLASDGVNLAYRTLQNPTVTRQAGPGFNTPWWAGISIQGHLLGLLAGVALGLVVFSRRGERPNPIGLWVGTLLFVVGENLWALWWFRGDNEFVLFRGLGLWFVLALSLLIVVALLASDRPMPAWLTRRRTAEAGVAVAVLAGVAWVLAGTPGGSLTLPAPNGGVPIVAAGLAVVVLPLSLAAVRGGEKPLFENYSRREVARLAVLLPLVFSAVVTIPTNLATVDDAESPGIETIEVRDYSVTYAEDVENQMVSVVNLTVFGETTQVETSGVIVISESRHIWTNEVSASRLKFTGTAAARVGGIGWRERVIARRTGWSAAGGGAAYKVYLRRGGEDRWRRAYSSSAAVAGPQLRGLRVAIAPAREGFRIGLIDNGSTVARAPIPPRGGSVNLSSITIERDGDTLFASYNGTRVKVANKESYN